MARESTSTTVSPSEEQSTINLFQIFGWELVSSQEVYNKDSHLESRDDGLYNVTSTTHYVKLVFTRETTMPNYAKLVALENEFYNIKMPTYYEPTGSNLLKYGGGALFGFGFLFLAMGKGGTGALPLIAGIALLVIRGVIKFKAESDHDTLTRSAKQKRAEVLERAEQVWQEN